MSNATNTVLITGNTFPVKDALRALGGRWNAGRIGWEVPAAREAEARQLVAGAGPKTAAPSLGRASRATGRVRAAWRPCGYPGCNSNYCDDCDGLGGGRDSFYGR